MNLHSFDKRIIFIIASQVVLALALVLLIDWGISETIEKSKVISLSQQSEGDLSTQQSRLLALHHQVGGLKKEIAIKASLRYPTLQDLKKQAVKHNLNLRNIEKGSQTTQKKADTIKYLTSFVGRMSSLVNYLKDVESQYLLDADGLSLKPADDKGETVVMTISLLVSE